MDAAKLAHMQRLCQDVKPIGDAFVSEYYQRFCANRASLEVLYHEDCFLTFEADTRVGKAAAMAKLLSLPFEVVAHAISTQDYQPTADGGIIIFVNGLLQVEHGSDRKLPFSHTFYIKEFGGTFFIMNDMFRLSMHNF